jgi:hypothetical protein
MDTCQLTSSQGEADGVSEWEYDLAGIGGGECALRLVPRQRVAPLYRWSRSHTHTYTQDKADSPPHPSNTDNNNADDNNADNDTANDNADNDADIDADNNGATQTMEDDTDATQCR